MSTSAQVPRLTTRMVEALLPAAVAEPLLGDLEEVFHARIASGTPLPAVRRWFRAEAVRAVVRLQASRFRASPPIRHSSNGDGFMLTLLSDTRFALRVLLRQPMVTCICLLTLAMGIGATTAIYSAVKPILFDALPYPHGERIVQFGDLGADGGMSNIGFATYADVAAEAKSFEATAAVGGWEPTIAGSGDPDVLTGQRVSWSYFDVLGVKPALGRTFDRSEDMQSASRVVILSDALWRSRFGADASLIGRSIALNGTPYTVIGVMPHGFENVTNPTAQLWTALRYDTSLPYACRSCRHLRAFGRLRADVSIAHASRELNVLAHRMAQSYPKEYANVGLPMESLRQIVTRGVRPAMVAVLGAVALLLLIACTNVMNLLLARSAHRRGEFSVRAALGASRGRVVRQVLTESMLLALAGGALGIGVAQLGVRGLVALSPADMPRLAAIQVDSAVLVFAMVVTCAAGLLFGTLPALDASRRDLATGIRLTGRRMAKAGKRARTLLVVSQVALALMLLIGAGLLMRSLQHLFAVNPGFNPESVVVMHVQTAGTAYADDSTVWRFYEQAIRNVRAVPGVERASFVSQLPLSGDFDMFGVHREDRVNPNPELDQSAHRYVVIGDYFDAMRIPILRGRGLNQNDRAGSEPVVVIGESFAKRVWPGEDPIGKRVRVGAADRGAWRKIVGIAGDVRQVSLAGDEPNAIYYPSTQWDYADNGMWLVARTRGGDPTQLSSALRNAIWAVDRTQPITRIASMRDVISSSATERRFALTLFEAFALVALILAGAGIYGVLAAVVGERMPEIGLRSALGARRGMIVGLVLRDAMRMTVTGVIIGGLCAAMMTRFIAGMLFGVAENDPATYLGVVVLLTGVALFACAAPAWRAARVDPAVSLKSE